MVHQETVSVSQDQDECVMRDNVLEEFKFAVELFEDGSAGLVDRDPGIQGGAAGAAPVFYTGATVSQALLSADDLGQGTETDCSFGLCRKGGKCCVMAYDIALGYLCPTDENYCV